MACVLTAALPADVQALGIRLFDHDAFATARGDAFAATADNPSAIYYNPAGITQLPGHNARASLNLLSLEIGYDSGRRELDTDNPVAALPNVFYTYTPANLPVSFGVGYYLPYGLSLEYPDDAPFRTTITYGELQYHTINPVMAWKPHETLSIAAGPTLNYACTDLRRGIFARGDEFKFIGDDYDVGFTAGLLWQPFTRHSFGVSYRSRTTMKFEGKSEFFGVPLPKQDAATELPFPQVFIVGYSFRPTPAWNFEVNVDWTDWESVDTPVLEQSTGNVALPLQWENSWALELGATRYFENGLHVSGGYVFLENSIPNSAFTPLIPDQDLHVFSTGIGGKHNRLMWDVTYQFTYGPGRDISSSVYGPAVSGEYTFIAHAFSISVGWQF